MNHAPLGALTLALLSLTTSCGGDAGGEPQVLRVSGIPDSKGTEIDALAEAVETYLSVELGMEVEYINATNYDAAVAMFGSNKIDLGWFGGVTGVDAVDACAGEAQMIATRQKDLAFKTYFIANRAVVDAGRIGPVDRLEELAPRIRDLSFTFGNLRSTSGHIMPRHFMVQAGIDPAEGVRGGAKHQDNHSMTLDAVADGRIDVGAVNYTNYELASDEKKAQAVLIYETEPYVDYCLVARDSLGAELVSKVRAAFEKLDPTVPEHRAMLDAFKAERFVAADSSQWQMIRDVMSATGLLK
ncbi:MAG: PhnD/SsuA/transferrin family substrate-binding protein [Planctomycetota bacterium]